MSFTITLLTVASMLLYAVPGYFLVKSKAVRPDSISAFSKLLMFVSQPCLTLYTFQKVACTYKVVTNMLFFFMITFLLLLFMLVLFYLLIKKKRNNVDYRVCVVATCFGNCAFMGVPIVEALLPEYPDAVLLSSMFFLSMSLLGWTAGCMIITRDKKYISLRNIIINPAVISIAVSVPFFALKITLPSYILDVVTLLGKMTTPLCMLVMGMRLATMRFGSLFSKPLVYAAVFIKQILFPLLALGVVSLLPLDINLKQTLFILCACPVASVVQNYAEIIGEGQDTAANLVLLGTLSSVITIPVVLSIL